MVIGAQRLHRLLVLHAWVREFVVLHVRVGKLVVVYHDTCLDRVVLHVCVAKCGAACVCG